MSDKANGSACATADYNARVNDRNGRRSGTVLKNEIRIGYVFLFSLTDNTDN